MRRTIFVLLALTALAAAVPSSAKEFRPGDVRACAATRCVALVERRTLRELAALIYGDSRPVRADPLRPGSPVLRLRYRNGYVAGLVGGRDLDRFRSHGVFCGRFRRGVWYRVPPPLARDLRRAAAGLERLHLRSAVPPSC